MEYRREHPIRILTRMPHFAILLIFPVLRALLFSGGNLYHWLSGVWIDILVLLGITFLSLTYWYFDLYRFSKRGVYRFKGIFKIQKKLIPFCETTTVVIERPWYLKIIGGSRLKIDTPAGGMKNLDLSLIITGKETERFSNYFKPNQTPYTMTAKVWSIAALSLISSNSFTGVLFISALISQSGQILGNEFENLIVNNFTKTAEILAVGIPPAAAIVALLIGLGWLVSFVLNIVRYAKFSVSTDYSVLTIKTGIWINKRTYYIERQRVSFLEVRQTILTMALRISSALINTPGYGKAKGESPILIPTLSNRNSLKNLETFFPHLPFGKRNVRPLKKDFPRFLVMPITFLFILLIIMIISQILFPSFTSIILFFGGMLASVLIVYFIAKILSFSRTGFGLKDGVYTLEYCRGFLFKKISFSQKKLCKIHIRQTVFQKKDGCCTVIFYTYGEKRKRHLITNLPLDDVEKELLSVL